MKKYQDFSASSPGACVHLWTASSGGFNNFQTGAAGHLNCVVTASSIGDYDLEVAIER